MAEFLEEAHVQGDSDDRAQNSAPIALDPLYAQTIALMQEGRWAEAADGVEALEQRYPGSVELEAIREHLSLHLSAEGSWAPPGNTLSDGMDLPGLLAAPIVRLLLAANLVLYLLLAALLLLARFGPSSH